MNSLRAYQWIARIGSLFNRSRVIGERWIKHLKDDPKVEIINVHGKGYKLIM
jgi:hypothetical protein